MFKITLLNQIVNIVNNFLLTDVSKSFLLTTSIITDSKVFEFYE